MVFIDQKIKLKMKIYLLLISFSIIQSCKGKDSKVPERPLGKDNNIIHECIDNNDLKDILSMILTENKYGNDFFIYLYDQRNFKKFILTCEFNFRLDILKIGTREVSIIKSSSEKLPQIFLYDVTCNKALFNFVSPNGKYSLEGELTKDGELLSINVLRAIEMD
jgi:hypothetical protein